MPPAGGRTKNFLRGRTMVISLDAGDASGVESSHCQLGARFADRCVRFLQPVPFLPICFRQVMSVAKAQTPSLDLQVTSERILTFSNQA